MDRAISRDLKTLARFVELYCRGLHGEAPREAFALKGIDVPAISGRPVPLCRDCARLLAHAFVKRMHCPMDPKPACKKCPKHCYHPTYRQQMREVMRYSGRRLVLSGRVDYLIHMLS